MILVYFSSPPSLQLETTLTYLLFRKKTFLLRSQYVLHLWWNSGEFTKVLPYAFFLNLDSKKIIPSSWQQKQKVTLPFTFWASPQHILLHFPIHLLHFPIKFASFPQKNASFPQQFAAFPQQNASSPQQFAAFPYAMLCHVAKKYFTKYSQFFLYFWH